MSLRPSAMSSAPCAGVPSARSPGRARRAQRRRRAGPPARRPGAAGARPAHVVRGRPAWIEGRSGERTGPTGRCRVTLRARRRRPVPCCARATTGQSFSTAQCCGCATAAACATLPVYSPTPTATSTRRTCSPLAAGNPDPRRRPQPVAAGTRSAPARQSASACGPSSACRRAPLEARRASARGDPDRPRLPLRAGKRRRRRMAGRVSRAVPAEDAARRLRRESSERAECHSNPFTPHSGETPEGRKRCE